MEILLKAGDIINIPTGCIATIKDNQIIIEEQKEVFKDGDILCTEDGLIFTVFESYEVDNNNYTFCSYYNTAEEDNKRWVPQYFHVASVKEQQLFFKKLEEKDLIWDINTRRVYRL